MDKKLKPLNKKEWKELQERVKEKDRLQSDHMGVNLFTVVFNVELEVKSPTTICNEIEAISWYSMPISMRVTDFCNHCEFKCVHGKEIIKMNNKRKSEQ